jgi:NADPH-dependent glutamate synthase beta subunit-like oxidoreductase
MRTDYGHAEVEAKFGHDPRVYCISAKEFLDDGRGNLNGVKTVEVEWTSEGGKFTMKEKPGSEKTWEAELILLAMGFLGPEHYAAETLGLELDPRSNYKATHGKFATSVEGVFAAGDCRRGQSLVVWAINEGRGAARAIDEYLMGYSTLPAPGVTNGLAMAR